MIHQHDTKIAWSLRLYTVRRPASVFAESPFLMMDGGPL